MKHLMIVAFGGALGAAARWKLSETLLHHTANSRFPIGILVVNLLGCVVAGLLVGLTTKLGWFSAEARLFLFTGVLGGFTTFSSFGVETVTLIRRSDYTVALAYVVCSVAGGIAGLWLAMSLVPTKTSN